MLLNHLYGTGIISLQLQHEADPLKPQTAFGNAFNRVPESTICFIIVVPYLACKVGFFYILIVRGDTMMDAHCFETESVYHRPGYGLRDLQLLDMALAHTERYVLWATILLKRTAAEPGMIYPWQLCSIRSGE